MRILSYILMAVGILLLLNAAYDELHGRTTAPSAGTGYGVLSSSFYHDTITRTGDPEDFRNAMAYHWSYACLILVAGVVARVINRRQDKLDPMSGDLDPNIDAELKEDELEEQAKDGNDSH